MTGSKQQKRLVLIGIRRKGEKGFKKSVDTEFKINNTNHPVIIDRSKQIAEKENFSVALTS